MARDKQDAIIVNRTIPVLADLIRMDLFRRDLGNRKDLIEAWMGTLEERVIESYPYAKAYENLKCGKILSLLLLQALKKENINRADLDNLPNAEWEEPYNRVMINRDTGQRSVIKDAYRIYFTMPYPKGTPKENRNLDKNAYKDGIGINFLTTMTDSGLIVFSFEDKIEEIDHSLFKELAKYLPVKSDALNKLTSWNNNDEPFPDLPKILGLITYALIYPDGEDKDNVFNNICSLLVKSSDHPVSTIIVELLRDIIPDYDNKVSSFVKKENEPVHYDEKELRKECAFWKLPSAKTGEIIASLKNYKELKENENRKAQANAFKTTLLGAVDEYLKWREDKNTTEGYQKKSGWFTSLRHFTAFGKQRAEKLRQDLDNAPDLQSMRTILEKHLDSKDSRLHNHSFDAYLLRALQKDSNQFTSIVDLGGITNGDTKSSRELRKTVVLQELKNNNMNVIFQNPTADKQDSSTAKARINIMKISADERNENISSVKKVLENEELLSNQGGSFPIIIKEIRDIVENIDPSEEENIANAIIEIKRKIEDRSDNNYSDMVQFILNAFAQPSCCDFRKIRAALTENPKVDKIMNSVEVYLTPETSRS